MPTKTKKSKASGRFGARYGKKVRARLAVVESKQRVKQECPFCGKEGVKRVSRGIWHCKKCDKKFASDVYYLPKSIK
jgi:large subunit ribosomal protein L37Ae